MRGNIDTIESYNVKTRHEMIFIVNQLFTGIFMQPVNRSIKTITVCIPINITCIMCNTNAWHISNMSSGPVFIKHLKSNVYVTLNAIGSFQRNLCSHWLIQIFFLSFFMNTGPAYHVRGGVYSEINPVAVETSVVYSQICPLDSVAGEVTLDTLKHTVITF